MRSRDWGQKSWIVRARGGQVSGNCSYFGFWSHSHLARYRLDTHVDAEMITLSQLLVHFKIEYHGDFWSIGQDLGGLWLREEPLTSELEDLCYGAVFKAAETEATPQFLLRQ